MEIRELTCINCPMGCRLSVAVDGGKVISVEGNTCKRGETYARTEVVYPVRIVTTTIKVVGGQADRVSCKTKSPIPKSKIFEVMEQISKSSCNAPIEIGDVLIENCAGTGVSVIATKNIGLLIKDNQFDSL